MAWLQHHLVSDRLTLEEFPERVEQAYAARVQAELERLRSGLPAIEQRPAAPAPRRATRVTGAFLGKVVKRGRVRLRRWTVARGAFCDVDLDLRQAPGLLMSVIGSAIRRTRYLVAAGR